jgi:hypothetical protein
MNFLVGLGLRKFSICSIIEKVAWHLYCGQKARMHLSPSLIQPYLESDFPAAFKLMLATGTHPSVRSTPINPYTGKDSGEWFGNIGDHAVVVGWCAEQLCQKLSDKGVMTAEQCRDTTFRALIHDIGKPFEIFRRGSLADATSAYKPYATANLLDRLLAHGYEMSAARRIVSAGSEVGHLSLGLFIDRTMNPLCLRPAALESKIIFLSDAFASGSVNRVDGATLQELVPSRTRIETPRFRERYPWMFSAGLSRNSNGDLEYVWEPGETPPNLGSFADLQVLVARAIAEELLQLLEHKRFQDSEALVLSILEESYRALQEEPVSVGF